MVWSLEVVVVGDDCDFKIVGVPEQKGTSRLALLLAPLDALLRQVDILVEAHLLDLLSVAGMAPIFGFFSDAGDSHQTKSRGRVNERARLGGDELGFYGGALGSFIAHGMVGIDATSSETAQMPR
jgi:hypothetical protein